MSNYYALITGASSGIGKEIARELAKRDYSLILVSNQETELNETAQLLAAEYRVSTHPIHMDLATPEAALDLYQKVKLLNIEIEILVSNAGMFFFKEIAESVPTSANAMIQLHVSTPSLLAHYFAKDMRTRRRGHILFTSSIAAWGNFPGLAWYGSSKHYIRSFAASLREELQVWGVNVTCLAPGAVATGLYEQTGVPVQTAVKYKVMSDPAKIARKAVQGMFKHRAVVIPGFSAKLMAFFMAIAPTWLIMIIRKRMSLFSKPEGGPSKK